jgi:hypothetical protein
MHCCHGQQERIAHLARSILGSKLALPTDGWEAASPEQRRGRILLKGKTLRLSPGAEAEDEADQPDNRAPQEQRSTDGSRVRSSTSDAVAESVSGSLAAADGSPHGDSPSCSPCTRLSSLKEDDAAAASLAAAVVLPPSTLDEPSAGGGGGARGGHKVSFQADCRPARCASVTTEASAAKRRVTAASLSNVTYLSAVKFRGQPFIEPPTDGRRPPLAPWEMSSYGENKAMALLHSELAGEHAWKWQLHNTAVLSRVYPAGSRVMSSNFDPFGLWAAGVQMVALNYQTHDHHQQCNRGFFRLNGGVGYVLKPPALTDAAALANPSVARPLAPPAEVEAWEVTLLCGRLLPKAGEERATGEPWLQAHCPLARSMRPSDGPVSSPSVTIEVFGGAFAAAAAAPADAPPPQGEKWESAAVARNGFDPNWGGERAVLFASHPSLAVVRVSVYDEKTTTAAQRALKGRERTLLCYECVPLAALRDGLRSLPLRDRNGARLHFAALLLRVRRLGARPLTTPSPELGVGADGRPTMPPRTRSASTSFQNLIRGRSGSLSAEADAQGSRWARVRGLRTAIARGRAARSASGQSAGPPGGRFRRTSRSSSVQLNGVI